MGHYKRQWHGWNVLYGWLIPVFTGVTVLCGVSCRTQERSTRSAEAIAITQGIGERLTLAAVKKSAEAVAGEETTLKIPVANLKSLPEGSGYQAREGRSSVAVTARGDTVYVTARCDSLERVIDELYYRSESWCNKQI